MSADNVNIVYFKERSVVNRICIITGKFRADILDNIYFK